MKILSKNNKKGFLDINNIDKLNCDWNMIIGERSNGKTYGVLSKILDDYIKTDRPSVLIRRKEETIRPANIAKLFESHEKNGYLKKLGCDAVVYSRRAFYCAYEEQEGKFKKADKPFMYCTSINTSETTKGTFPTVNTKNIVFDEFLTRESYLPNEYTRLMNLISTVKREVTDCKIWMLANTVSWSSPYFREFGLNNINKQEKGTINIYDYTDGENMTSLAVEYCTSSTNKNKKESDRYFAFGSPQLRMIKNGSWEVANYNHMDSENYKNSMLISRNYYMINDLDTVCLEMRKSSILGRFIFVRPQTHPIDIDRAVVVYTTNTIDTRKHQTVLTKSKVDNLIIGLYNRDRFYYADNTCGETVRNVLQTMNIRFKELHT